MWQANPFVEVKDSYADPMIFSRSNTEWCFDFEKNKEGNKESNKESDKGSNKKSNKESDEESNKEGNRGGNKESDKENDLTSPIEPGHSPLGPSSGMRPSLNSTTVPVAYRNIRSDVSYYSK